MKISDKTGFIVELEHLVNKHGIDDDCNTPDFILVEYIINALESYKQTKERNDDWHMRELDSINISDPTTVKITQENYDHLRVSNKLKPGQVYIIVENPDEENYVEV